ncbi:MAG TPA: CPBP family intramembrane metalloprotease [Phycisphaerae bacterium]|nr:CPBP family intramembrane metalloprotease [Phycisphaerae bacterium]
MIERLNMLLPGERLLYAIMIGGGILLPFAIFKWVLNPEYYRRFRNRPNTFTPFDFILLLLVWLTMNFILGRLAAMAAEGDRVTVKLIVILSVQLAIVPLELYICKYRFAGGLGRGGLGLMWKNLFSDVILAAACIIVVLPVCNVLAGAVTYWLRQFPDFSLHEHELLRSLGSVGTGGKILIIVSATVGAPVFEELFFRGILQSMLRRALSPWPAILITGIFFAVVHPEIQNWPSLMILAASLGWTYEKTGRIMLPILIHAMFNAVYIAAYLLGVPKVL